MPFTIDRNDVISGMGSKTVSGMFPSWDPTGSDSRLTITKTDCTTETEIGMDTNFSAVAVDGKEYKKILALVKDLAGDAGSSPSFETIINGIGTSLEAASDILTPEEKTIDHTFGFTVKACPPKGKTALSTQPEGEFENVSEEALKEAATAVGEAAEKALELVKEAEEKKGAAQIEAGEALAEAAAKVGEAVRDAADAIAVTPVEPGNVNLKVTFEMKGSWVITDKEAATDKEEYAKVVLMVDLDGETGSFSGQHAKRTTNIVPIPIPDKAGGAMKFIATVTKRNLKLPVRIEPRIYLAVGTNGPGDEMFNPLDWLEDLIFESVSAILVNKLRIRITEIA